MTQAAAKLCTGGGFAAIVLWSTTFAFARSLSEQVGPLTAGAAVHLVGGGACLLHLRLSGKALPGWLALPRWYLFGCGSLFVFYTAAIYLAVGLAADREQVLEIALVNYLWPTLTILLSLALLRNRGNFWLLPGTALALVGVFLVMTQGAPVSWMSFGEHLRKNPAAYLLALAAAVSWALYSNLTRRWAVAGSGGAVEWFLIAAGLVLLGLRVLVSEPTGWGLRPVAEMLGLAAATALAYLLWDLAMRKGNLLLVVAMSYFTPLFSTVLSCAYLKVSPGSRLWLGCILLVCGSFLTWRSISNAPAQRPA
jgi:drug/metabolite transporter (DMT)-like permease